MLSTIIPALSETVVAMQQRGGDAGGGAVAGIMGIVYLAVLVAVLAGMWKIFSKAGQPGWAAIVPIYSALVLLKIVGRPWWWLVVMLVPMVGLVIAVMVMLDLAKVFGRGVGFAIGLLLLPVVFIPLLGFGDSQYVGSASTDQSFARAA